MNKRMWIKVEEGNDGKMIGRLPGGKIVLFRVKEGRFPPVGRTVDTIIVEEDDRKAIGEWTGAMKPPKK